MVVVVAVVVIVVLVAVIAVAVRVPAALLSPEFSNRTNREEHSPPTRVFGNDGNPMRKLKPVH